MNNQRKNIIIDNNIKYYIFNSIIYNNNFYAICSNYKNPKEISIFQCRYNNNSIEIRNENDTNIIKNILEKSISKENERLKQLA